MRSLPINDARCIVVVGLILSFFCTLPAHGEIFMGADFIAVDHADNAVRAYNLGGIQQGSDLDITYSGTGTRPPNRVGGATFDAAGNLHVYNGIFQPVLSTVDVNTTLQSDQVGVGFSSVNRTNVGNVAAIANNVFVTDNNTSGSTTHGIVAFDTSNSFSSQRFAADYNPNDVVAGLDGRLYALGVVNTLASANPNTIRVYDPNNFALLDSITLSLTAVGKGVTGIAVDQSGGIFASTNDGFLLDLAADGSIASQLDLATSRLNDLDIRSDGALLAGGIGSVFLSDVGLASFTPINVVATGDVHVSFNAAAVPEPGVAFPLFAAASIWFVRQRRRRRDVAESTCQS